MNSVKRKARTALTLAAAGLMIYTGSLVIKNVNESWKLKRNASQIESVLDNSELARNTLELYKESGKISPLDYSILKDKIDEREQEIKSWNKVSLYTYNYSDGEKLANSPSDQSAQNPEVESLESPKETPTTFKYNLGLTPREKSIELLGHEPTDEGRIDLEGKVLSGEYLGRFGFDRYVFQIETQIGNKEITYSNYADDYRADVVQSLARKGVYIKIPAVYEKWAVNQNLDNLSLNNYIDSNDNSKGTSETNIQTYIPEGIKYNVRQFLGKYDIGQLYTKEDSILLLGHIPNFYQEIILKGKIISIDAREKRIPLSIILESRIGVKKININDSAAAQSIEDYIAASDKTKPQYFSIGGINEIDAVEPEVTINHNAGEFPIEITGEIK